MQTVENRTKFVVVAALGLCGAAFYFGRGSHSQWVDFGFRTLNFALFITVFWLAAGGRVKAFLNGRSRDIANELSGLEQARELAVKKLKETEARISNLDKERQAIIASYKAQGEALKSEIIVKAEKSARQIVAQAKLAAQNEVEQATRRMRGEMAEEIVAEAERLLRERLDAAGHERLIHRSLSKVVLN